MTGLLSSPDRARRRRRRRRQAYAPLRRRRYWKGLGRRDARRALRPAGTHEHLGAEELRTALRFEVRELRTATVAELADLDERRASLSRDCDELSEVGTSNPATRRKLGARLGKLQRELARLDADRLARNGVLTGRVDLLVATAQRADAAYRRAYQDTSHSRDPLAPADLSLPPELVGPIDDPLHPLAP